MGGWGSVSRDLSRSDDNPLAVVQGYLVTVKDSPAQDVLVTHHHNGGGWDRGETNDLDPAKIDGSVKNTPVC